MEYTESNGNAYRIKKCAIDLLSVEDYMEDDDDGSWDLMAREIRLKSTFLFCDFEQLISHASEDQKKFLITLANRLFSCIQELDQAMKVRSISLTRNRYNETALLLQEVITAMPGDIIVNQRL